MKDLQLALSQRVKKSRYVSLTKHPRVDGAFYAGFEYCLPDLVIDRDNFPFWTLEYIADGQGNIALGNQHASLQPGSLICYGPKIPIRFQSEPQNPFHKYFLCHTDDSFPQSWRSAGLKPGTITTLAIGVPFTGVIDQLLIDGDQGAVDSASVLGAIDIIFLSMIRCAQQMTQNEESGTAHVYQVTLQVMAKEFRALNSLNELAERTGYGPEYLCRVFRKHHSESPYQALQRMKMNEAFRLLKEGRQRVMDIAVEVGYEDPLHFSRVFRRTMGFPPSIVNQ